MCKHKDRLLHVSLLKASYLFFPNNYVNKTLQSKPRNGDSIWWVMEPHCNLLSTLLNISFKPYIKINFIFTIWLIQAYSREIATPIVFHKLLDTLRNFFLAFLIWLASLYMLFYCVYQALNLQLAPSFHL